MEENQDTLKGKRVIQLLDHRSSTGTLDSPPYNTRNNNNDTHISTLHNVVNTRNHSNNSSGNNHDTSGVMGVVCAVLGRVTTGKEEDLSLSDKRLD